MGRKWWKSEKHDNRKRFVLMGAIMAGIVAVCLVIQLIEMNGISLYANIPMASGGSYQSGNISSTLKETENDYDDTGRGDELDAVLEDEDSSLEGSTLEGSTLEDETLEEGTVQDSILEESTEENVVGSGSVAETEASSYVKLDVTYLSQYPELPTGCEITSLTTVLNYYGYHVSKETMASRYLEKTTSGSFYEKFVGDPTTNYGYGCYAKPIVKAANKYFKINKIQASAIDLSGSSFDDILSYVAHGYPIVIWNTMNMAEAYQTDSWEVDGEIVTWTAPEHCVVLIGYDLNRGIVYVSDPMIGIVERDLNTFEDRYISMSKQAVYITQN